MAERGDPRAAYPKEDTKTAQIDDKDEPGPVYRPAYLTAKLRRSRYRVARSMGFDTPTAEKIKDWSRNKFILYIYTFRVKVKT